MTGRDYYQVLGVARAATAGDIRAAYVRLSRRHHPDMEGQLPARLREVQQAYRCLSDEGRRAEHDRAILAGERLHAARQARVQRRLHGYDRRHPRHRPGPRRRWPWRRLLAIGAAAAIAQLSWRLLW